MATLIPVEQETANFQTTPPGAALVTATLCPGNAQPGAFVQLIFPTGLGNSALQRDFLCDQS